MPKTPIKDFYGRVQGFLDDQGNQIVATDFYGRRLGHYDKARNKTFDFYGRLVCEGDGTSRLVMNAEQYTP